MSRRLMKWVIPTVVIVMLAAMLLLTMARAVPEGQVMSVDGNPVFEDEFLMLLRQNETQYENRLREEYAIPSGQSVLEYLNGDESEYRRLLFEQNVAFVTSCRVEQALAKEYGLAPEFTYQGFLDALEAENKNRADKIAKGEAVYGLQSFLPEQYYSYKMSNLTTAVIEALPEKLLAVTDEEMAAYYNGMDSFANIDGETITYTMYDVTAAADLSAEAQSVLYGDVMEALTEGTCADITAENATYRAERRDFTPRELRDFVRQSFDGEILLSLSEHEILGPIGLGERQYIAQYNGFERAKTIAPDDEAVFTRALREEAYQKLVAEKATQANVKVNQSWLDSYISATDTAGN